MPHAANDRLLMVYNADGGWVNGALDLAHKIASPATYACRLCEVSYGTFGMRREWRDYLATLPLPVVFHHRDDFAAAHPRATVALPVILREHEGVLETLISADDFAGIRSLDALQALLTARVAPPA